MSSWLGACRPQLLQLRWGDEIGASGYDKLFCRWRGNDRLQPSDPNPTVSARRHDGVVIEENDGHRSAAGHLPDCDAFDLEGVAYLNCAYMGPLPRRSVEAGRAGLERKGRPWEVGVPDFFEPLERARSLFAHLVGGDADGVCIVPSVSYGIALAATNVRVGRGETIVVLSEQFPSNVYMWHDLATRSGAQVVSVPRPVDDDWTDGLEQAIDERCAVVAIPACHWTDGTAVDLARVGDRARSMGAALVVDACQAAGALPLDVKRIQPDFLVSAAYKWLLGPYSVGFCWVAPKRREGRPLEQNWITRAGSDNFAALADHRGGYAPGARRYDMGEASNFALLPVAIASMELLAGWGTDAAAAHSRSLTSAIATGASDLGFGVPPQPVRSPHLLGLRMPSGLDPAVVAAHLREQGVHVSVRGTSLRVSTHVFNTHEDVNRLLQSLEETQRETQQTCL